ncbi:hypothetical protein EXN66_Car009942 [Channa argus]|uniref:Uncharacterized protein n=1 Tax=Channa argus TaxID=215402 RepID=A0A6G1PWB2_CHAAH|nr:hypothetical protein EXN66_Car009942 [Channa argus]
MLRQQVRKWTLCVCVCVQKHTHTHRGCQHVCLYLSRGLMGSIEDVGVSLGSRKCF